MAPSMAPSKDISSLKALSCSIVAGSTSLSKPPSALLTYLYLLLFQSLFNINSFVVLSERVRIT